MVKGVRGAYDAGDKLGENLEKLKGKMFKKGSVYHDEDLGVNIERDSDSTGSLTDKIPTDTLHSKEKKK